MKQGEIWEMYFDPIAGSEQSGRRPALIISGNVLNTYLPVVIVCPLTTKIKNYKGNLVLQPTAENGLATALEILTFDVRSVDKQRLKRRVGHIDPEELRQVILGLNEILKY